MMRRTRGSTGMDEVRPPIMKENAVRALGLATGAPPRPR
jgi:hypothetical protein